MFVLLVLVLVLDHISGYLDELLFLCTLGFCVIIFQLYFEQVWALALRNFHCLSTGGAIRELLLAKEVPPLL